MDTDEMRINQLTELVIGCAFRVQTCLGFGFMEKCYENALAHELRKHELKVVQQIPLNVWYDGIVVGEYIADMIINDILLIEVKAISGLDSIHSAQCINYLAATKLPICLLINFGKRVDVKRLAGQSFSSSSVSICAPSVAK